MSISILLVRTLVQAVNHAGVSTDSFLAAAGADRSLLHDAFAYIPLEVYDRLQLQAMALTGDAALGLHMAEQVPLTSLSTFGHLLLNCESLQDALNVFNRYHALVSKCEPSQLHYHGDTAILTYDFPRSHPECNRLRADYGLCAVVQLAHLLTGDVVQPSLVEFEHAPPDYASEYQRIFRCRIAYRARHTRIHVPTRFLQSRFGFANAELRRFLGSQAEALLRARESSSLPDRIRILIKEQYRGQRPSLDVIAGSLQMSGRSLRRHLQHSGINFTSLLDEIQLEIANMLLREPSLSVKRIALQLGFDEPSSFSRAYKRWSGMSPAQFREQLQHSDAAPAAHD
jgi:AraC-like DNA-binding protein